MWNFSSRDQRSETKTSVARKITTSTPRAARALSRCMPLWMRAVGNRITTALTARWACVWCRRLMPCIGLPNPANLNALHDSSAIRMCVFCLCFCVFVCFSVSSNLLCMTQITIHLLETIHVLFAYSHVPLTQDSVASMLLSGATLRLLQTCSPW